ncbi:Lrp/AsnC family transcriptional regulator [Streptomyces sp. SID14478]|uniref:Lrp/AsnC family transcriptional regulator n=1 Tax=Streptomyces sp. SID14478 TaxID=2706073 RepID=UPI0031BB7CBE
MESPTTLDDLDRQLLHALQVDGRAPFNRIAAVLGVSDQTVARRYRRLHNAVNLRVLGMTDESVLGRQSWLVRLHCVPDVAEQLADALAKRPDTLYVALTSGGTEIVCGMKPRTRKERDELLFDRFQRTPQIIQVTAHCLLHQFYGGQYGWLNKSQALSADQQGALRPATPAPPQAPVTLDADQEALLDVLRRDGRATLTELQKATGQSESAVRHRLEALRSTGVLYFDVQYDREPLGHAVGAMLWGPCCGSRGSCTLGVTFTEFSLATRRRRTRLTPRTPSAASSAGASHTLPNPEIRHPPRNHEGFPTTPPLGITLTGLGPCRDGRQDEHDELSGAPSTKGLSGATAVPSRCPRTSSPSTRPS